MRVAIDETDRRRHRQMAHNTQHGISPKGIIKAVKEIIEGTPLSEKYSATRDSGAGAKYLEAAEEKAEYQNMRPEALARRLNKLEKQMYEHARNLEFEQAAALRDKINVIRSHQFGLVAGGAGRR